jgi:hypothetical protein
MIRPFLFAVIARGEATKQSMFQQAEKMDRFAEPAIGPRVRAGPLACNNESAWMALRGGPNSVTPILTKNRLRRAARAGLMAV